jgi:hypothetical protein
MYFSLVISTLLLSPLESRVQRAFLDVSFVKVCELA